MAKAHPLLPILRLFGGVWILWFAAAALVPFTYESGSWLQAGLISAAYVVATAALAFALCLAMGGISSRSSQPAGIQTRVLLYAVLGLVGSSLLVYDRIFVQRIDLTAGLAAARQEWATLGQERQGISSVYSVAGNLMWVLSFVGLTFGYAYFESLRRARQSPLLAIVVSLAGIMTVSVLNGGRMPIIFAIALMSSVAAIRHATGLRVIPRISRFSKLGLLVIGLLGAGYMGYVLVDRASSNQFELADYATSSAEYLHGVPREGWTESKPGSVSAVTALSTAQLVHQFWVLQLIIDDPRREGSLLLSTPIYLLQKLGLFGDISADWTHAGLYLSLPGAAYHDLGIPGLLLLVLVHGFVLAACVLLMQRLSPVRLVAIILVFLTTLLSPLLPSFVAAPFPFMCAAFALPCVKLWRSRSQPRELVPTGSALSSSQ